MSGTMGACSANPSTVAADSELANRVEVGDDFTRVGRGQAGILDGSGGQDVRSHAVPFRRRQENAAQGAVLDQVATGGGIASGRHPASTTAQAAGNHRRRRTT